MTVHVRPGQAAVLHCPLLAASGGAASSFTSSLTTTSSPTSSSTLSWYRQVGEGRSPELLLALRTGPSGSNVRFGPGLGSDRLTATADGSLRLSAPQRSDTAVYYCSLSLRAEEEGGSWSSAGR